MLYGYFYKNQFIKFFLNFDSNDKSFFSNMCSSMGHHPNDVELWGYPRALRNDDSYFFDSNKDLVLFTREEIQVVDENDPEVMNTVSSVVPLETIQKVEVQYR